MKKLRRSPGDVLGLIISGTLIGIGLPMAIAANTAHVDDVTWHRWIEKASWIAMTIPLAFSLVFLLPGPRFWKQSPVALWLGVCLAGGAIGGLWLSNTLITVVGLGAAVLTAHLSPAARALTERLDFRQSLDGNPESGSSPLPEDIPDSLNGE